MKVYDWNAICQAFAPLYNAGKTVNEAYESLKESGYDLPHPCTFRVRIRQQCRAHNIAVDVRSHRSQQTTLPPVLNDIRPLIRHIRTVRTVAAALTAPEWEPEVADLEKLVDLLLDQVDRIAAFALAEDDAEDPEDAAAEDAEEMEDADDHESDD